MKDQLMTGISTALVQISIKDISGWFSHCGYFFIIFQNAIRPFAFREALF